MGSTFDFLDCLLGRARFRIRLAGARRLAGDVLVGHAGKYRPEVCSPQRCNDFWGKLTRKADGEPLRQLGNLPQPIDASSPDLALVGEKLPLIQRGTVDS